MLTSFVLDSQRGLVRRDALHSKITPSAVNIASLDSENCFFPLPQNIEFHEGWHQHPMLGHVPEPYVYQVPQLNIDALLSSIHQALKNPLKEPYIPKEVSKERFLNRLKWLIEEEDWEKKWRDARREYPPGKEWDVDY
jgi:hypothetical protein